MKGRIRKMKMAIKGGAYSIAAIMLWINGNFGEVFYLLAGLLILDALLNYKDEAAYLQKLMIYFVSAGSAFYIQNASLAGIPMARGLMVALAIHELAQVTLKAKDLITAWKASHPGQEPQADQMTSNLNQIATLVTAQILAAQKAQAVPMQVTPGVPPLGVSGQQITGGVNGE